MKYCSNCSHLSEDLVGGTGEIFCSCPNTYFEQGEFSLDTNLAKSCDFYEGSPTTHFVPGHWNGEAYVIALCGAEISCEEASSLFTNCPHCKTELQRRKG